MYLMYSPELSVLAVFFSGFDRAGLFFFFRVGGGGRLFQAANMTCHEGKSKYSSRTK